MDADYNARRHAGVVTAVTPASNRLPGIRPAPFIKTLVPYLQDVEWVRAQATRQMPPDDASGKPRGPGAPSCFSVPAHPRCLTAL